MSKKMVLSKFMIVCWAAFLAILGHMQPVGCGLDTPVSLKTVSGPGQVSPLVRTLS